MLFNDGLLYSSIEEWLSSRNNDFLKKNDAILRPGASVGSQSNGVRLEFRHCRGSVADPLVSAPNLIAGISRIDECH